MTDEELKALVASLALDSKELRESQKKTDEQMRKTDEQIEQLRQAQRQTDEQMRKTDEKLKSIGIQLGNMSQNQGDVAEEFFFNSLLDNPHLGTIHFDDIAKNESKHRGKVQEEYDIVMTNNEAIGIIEIKYKVHHNDLDGLERKMRNFKQLFPVYAKYKLYGAIASFHINDAAKREALSRGFFVLQRSGTVIQTEVANNLLVL